MARINKRVPGTFNAEIIKRFIKEGKDFDGFVEQYKNACHTNRFIRKPSDLDFRIAQAVKREKSLAYAEKTFKVSGYAVFSAIARVNAWEK